MFFHTRFPNFLGRAMDCHPNANAEFNATLETATLCAIRAHSKRQMPRAGSLLTGSLPAAGIHKDSVSVKGS